MSLYYKLKNSNSENALDLFRKTITYETSSRRLPINCTVELLPLCNFLCKMCYIRITEREANELGGILLYEDWINILGKCVDLGVINFTLTGGECTLHPDFVRIYRYLYEHGADISILTNGSLINDEIIETFKDMPPQCIYITVYGISEQTYEKMCGNPKAFYDVYSNIEKLKNIGFNIIIQFTGTKDNYTERAAVNDYANKQGLAFRGGEILMSYNKCTTDNVVKEQAPIDYFKARKDSYDKKIAIHRILK